MKFVFTIAVFFALNIIHAQGGGVGIGTITPKNNSVLDITATNKGVLLPRVDLSVLTGNSLTIFGLVGTDGPQEGMKVFNTSATAPFSKGEYIWYNGKWNSFNSGVVTASNGLTATSGNVTLGGSLTQATTIDQTTFPLQFKIATANGFNITDRAATPNTILSVDGVNKRVGIGTTAPTTALDINTVDTGSPEGIKVTRYSRTTDVGANLFLQRSYSNSLLGDGAVPDGEAIGRLVWRSNNGTGYNSVSSAEIVAEQVGLASSTNNGSQIKFATTAENSLARNTRMIIKSTGNVGIGTTTPTTLLDVAGTTKTQNFQMTAGAATGKILISDGFGNATWSSNPSVVTASNGLTATSGNVTLGGSLTQATNINLNGNNLQFTNGAIPILTTTSTGFLGLNTATPGTVLDIVNDNKSDSYDDISVRTYSTLYTPSLVFYKARGTYATPSNLINGDNIFSIMGKPYIGTNFVNLFVINSKYTGNGSTSLHNLSFSTSGTERIMINDAGNVGIGTLTPTTLLEVAGTTKTTTFQMTTGAATGKILISDGFGNATWSSNPSVVTASNGLTATAGNVTLGGSLTQATTVDQSTFPLQFKTATANGFNISDRAATPNSILSVDGANKRVGIGTSTPTTALDVAGTTKTTNFQMTTGAGSDKILTSDVNGNASWQNPQSSLVNKINIIPPSGTTSSYTIPCNSSYDVIQFTNTDANFATGIFLPSASCSVIGQKVRIFSTSNTPATISKNNTNAYGTTKVSNGDAYEYIFNNGKWELTTFPTKNTDFCSFAANGTSGETLINPTTPKVIFNFYNSCWGDNINLPTGGTLGDILIIDDRATLNLTINKTNTTMAANFLLKTGSYVQFIKTDLGWVKQF